MFILFFLVDLIGMAFFYGIMASNSNLPKNIKLGTSIGFGAFALAALSFFIAAVL